MNSFGPSSQVWSQEKSQEQILGSKFWLLVATWWKMPKNLFFKLDYASYFVPDCCPRISAALLIFLTVALQACRLISKTFHVHCECDLADWCRSLVLMWCCNSFYQISCGNWCVFVGGRGKSDWKYWPPATKQMCPPSNTKNLGKINKLAKLRRCA